MILTCPNCAARYKLRDDAIPPGGRTVRCKACAHAWHAEPPVWDLPEALPPGPVAADAPAAAPPDAAPVIETAPARRRWPWRLALFLLALLGSVAGLGWAVREGHVDPARVPGWAWLSSREFGPLRLPAPAPTELTLTASAVIRAVPGGGNVWEISGTVANTTKRTLPVPPVEVALLGNDGRRVYAWRVPPPAASLEPGRQARFQTTAVNTEASHVRLSLRPAALARP